MPCAPCAHHRQCAAGLQSIADVAAAIQAGYYNIGIAGGVESMSLSDLVWEGRCQGRGGGGRAWHHASVHTCTPCAHCARIARLPPWQLYSNDMSLLAVQLRHCLRSAPTAALTHAWRGTNMPRTAWCPWVSADANLPTTACTLHLLAAHQACPHHFLLTGMQASLLTTWPRSSTCPVMYRMR